MIGNGDICWLLVQWCGFINAWKPCILASFWGLSPLWCEWRSRTGLVRANQGRTGRLCPPCHHGETWASSQVFLLQSASAHVAESSYRCILYCEAPPIFLLWVPLSVCFSSCKAVSSTNRFYFFWWKAGDKEEKKKKKGNSDPNFYFQCRSDAYQKIEPETLSVQAFPRSLFSKEHQLLAQDWRGQQRP